MGEDVARRFVESLRAQLHGVRVELVALPSQAGGVASGELGDLVGDIAAVRAACESALVALGVEAVERGVVTSSTSANPAGWLRDHGLATAEVSGVSKAIDACLDPVNARLKSAVYAGEMTARGAVVAVRETEKLLPCLPEGFDRDELFGHFVTVAPDGLGDMRRLSDRLLAQYGQDRLERDVIRQHDVEDLSWRREPTGMWSFTALLAADHAAQFKAAVMALSAPRRAPDLPELSDPRPAGKRRIDALMTLITRAMGSDERQLPAGPSTQMVVTVDYAVLREGVGGLGSTTDGMDLDAGTLRRLACDADLIPVVLGGSSQPLDVGRSRRLASSAQRVALSVRDQGCTYPGCDRPPGWCIAHHIVHWLAQGETSLDNMALLCERHHTVVHRDRYTATIDHDGVHWHPPPHASVAA